MLVIDMGEEAFGTETFDIEVLELVWEAHDAKELGEKVFRIKEIT